MPDFNLAAMSLANLRDLQKSVAKAISTFEVRQKSAAREKVEMLAKELGFTLAELAELEEARRRFGTAVGVANERPEGCRVDDRGCRHDFLILSAKKRTHVIDTVMFSYD